MSRMNSKLFGSMIFVICVTASAADLGVANPYNLFILGNHTSSWTDVQGRVAVGGNATYNGFDVAGMVPPNPAQSVLVVGGSLSFTGGMIRNGGVNTGGNTILRNLTVTGGNVVSGGSVTISQATVNGAVLQNQPNAVPIDFVGAAISLTNNSTFWGSQTANSVVSNQFGTLYFNGTNPNLNIFSVSGQLLGNCYGVNISAPAGSTVLINVSGASGAMPNVGYNITGTDRGHVVYNFFQATTLTIGQSQGAVFAPQAAASFPYGEAVGTVVVKSLTGNGQININPFIGTLPDQNTPPGGPMIF
jgi:choice-of-anchor A domain-containing protein